MSGKTLTIVVAATLIIIIVLGVFGVVTSA
jgi:hypothetical protein